MLLQKIRIFGADENDPIIKNAVVELREGLKSMLELDPEIAFGPFVASSDQTIGVSAAGSPRDPEEFVDGVSNLKKEYYLISVC